MTKPHLHGPDGLPSGLESGDYVPLGVEEFQKAYSKFIHVMADLEPVDEGFEPGPQTIPGRGTIVAEDTPFNRAMYTAARLLPDAAKRQSFLWRVALVFGIAMGKKYSRYRNDEVGSMHIALITTVCIVRGNQRTPTRTLRSNFDDMFRTVLKEIEVWSTASSGSLH